MTSVCDDNFTRSACTWLGACRVPATSKQLLSGERTSAGDGGRTSGGVDRLASDFSRLQAAGQGNALRNALLVQR